MQGCLNLPVNFENRELYDRYGDLDVAVARVTPGLAAEWLQANKRNRPLSKSHVDHMEDVMLSGDMTMNGEPLIFDSNGDLMNGQHRLHACLRSGVCFDALVVRNVSPDAFDTLDGGRKRTIADVLGMNGESLPRYVAVGLSALFNFIESGGRIDCRRGRIATPKIAERLLKAHPRMRESVAAIRSQKLFDGQWVYCIHYLFTLVDNRLASELVEVLRNGSPDVGRPFNVLREQLIRCPRGSRKHTREWAAKMIKAFNAEYRRQRPKLIKFMCTEEFPEIEGLDVQKVIETL